MENIETSVSQNPVRNIKANQIVSMMNFTENIQFIISDHPIANIVISLLFFSMFVLNSISPIFHTNRQNNERFHPNDVVFFICALIPEITSTSDVNMTLTTCIVALIMIFALYIFMLGFPWRSIALLHNLFVFAWFYFTPTFLFLLINCLLRSYQIVDDEKQVTASTTAAVIVHIVFFFFFSIGTPWLTQTPRDIIHPLFFISHFQSCIFMVYIMIFAHLNGFYREKSTATYSVRIIFAILMSCYMVYSPFYSCRYLNTLFFFATFSEFVNCILFIIYEKPLYPTLYCLIPELAFSVIVFFFFVPILGTFSKFHALKNAFISGNTKLAKKLLKKTDFKTVNPSNFREIIKAGMTLNPNKTLGLIRFCALNNIVNSYDDLYFIWTSMNMYISQDDSIPIGAVEKAEYFEKRIEKYKNDFWANVYLSKISRLPKLASKYDRAVHLQCINMEFESRLVPKLLNSNVLSEKQISKIEKIRKKNIFLDFFRNLTLLDYYSILCFFAILVGHVLLTLSSEKQWRLIDFYLTFQDFSQKWINFEVGLWKYNTSGFPDLKKSFLGLVEESACCPPLKELLAHEYEGVSLEDHFNTIIVGMENSGEKIPFMILEIFTFTLNSTLSNCYEIFQNSLQKSEKLKNNYMYISFFCTAIIYFIIVVVFLLVKKNQITKQYNRYLSLPKSKTEKYFAYNNSNDDINNDIDVKDHFEKNNDIIDEENYEKDNLSNDNNNDSENDKLENDKMENDKMENDKLENNELENNELESSNLNKSLESQGRTEVRKKIVTNTNGIFNYGRKHHFSFFLAFPMSSLTGFAVFISILIQIAILFINSMFDNQNNNLIKTVIEGLSTVQRVPLWFIASITYSKVVYTGYAAFVIDIISQNELLTEFDALIPDYLYKSVGDVLYSSVHSSQDWKIANSQIEENIIKKSHSYLYLRLFFVRRCIVFFVCAIFIFLFLLLLQNKIGYFTQNELKISQKMWEETKPKRKRRRNGHLDDNLIDNDLNDSEELSDLDERNNLSESNDMYEEDEEEDNNEDFKDDIFEIKKKFKEEEMPIVYFGVDKNLKIIFSTKTAKKELKNYSVISGINQNNNNSSSNNSNKITDLDISRQVEYYMNNMKSEITSIPFQTKDTSLIVSPCYKFRDNVFNFEYMSAFKANEPANSMKEAENKYQKVLQSLYPPFITHESTFPVSLVLQGNSLIMIFKLYHLNDLFEDDSIGLEGAIGFRRKVSDVLLEKAAENNYFFKIRETSDQIIVAFDQQNKNVAWKAVEIGGEVSRILIDLVHSLNDQYNTNVVPTSIIVKMKEATLFATDERNALIDFTDDVVFQAEQVLTGCKKDQINYVLLVKDIRAKFTTKYKSCFTPDGKPFDLYIVV